MSNERRGRIYFFIFVVAMILSLFMGAVALLYMWPMIFILAFTFLFAFFLILAVYVYLSQSRQSMYEKLRAEKTQVEKESIKKSEYYANITHEIRTPINAIMGYNELILREYNDPALRQYANNIRSAANALLSIVNDSLDYSRIEAGKMALYPAVYDLGILVEELLNMTRPRVLSKGLDLSCHVDENIPRVLYGDADRLKQCIVNLLTNAVKYTEEGEIIFSVDYEYIDSDPDIGKKEILLKISVKDTGIGIKEEDLTRLYRPFERIDEDKNRSIEGTGLGISIVKKILALMGTKLEVDSVYGEGSDFHFAVRQEVMRLEPIGNFQQEYVESIVKQNVYHNRFTAPGVRILVVDDAEMNLSVVEELLKNTRIHIDSALSARTGLELANENDYDLIFADIKMPDMNGVDMVGALKNIEDDKKKDTFIRRHRRQETENEDVSRKNADTPCIALTAGTNQEIQEKYKKQGFSDYLLKPIVYKELERVLMEYIPSEKIMKTVDKNTDEPLLMTDEKLAEAIDVLKHRSRM